MQRAVYPGMLGLAMTTFPSLRGENRRSNLLETRKLLLYIRKKYFQLTFNDLKAYISVLILKTNHGGNEVKLSRLILISTAITASSLMMATGVMAGSAKHDEGHSAPWSYEGSKGPEHWGDLKSEYAACKDGKSQSPIDITGAVKADLKAIELNYSDSTLKVINNGHAIQVNYGAGSYAVIGGEKYNLIQFHFHGPSENTINGQAYPLEAHLVHKSEDGQLAVIGVMFKEGKKNSFIQKIWDNIPNKIGHEMTYLGLGVNANDLLPSDRAYYHFTGSLTTPPCSEGVSWNVMTTPIEVSSQQIARFASFYKMNARPVQALNERVIKLSR